MATANERILDKLDQITSSVGEVKQELVATTMQIETLANRQREANHRTEKAEARIAALEEKNVEEAKAQSFANGVQAGASGMILSKKQLTAGATVIALVVSVVEVIVKVIS